ncbi:MAG: hypothetical protein HZA78_09635 [Candidatus Schekmanbacteria bacterium]|nr:hypothetical protein [Candidatus Schekmanbacteria bacterium]
MIIKKNIQKETSLELPWHLLEKAHLKGKINIIVEENEILIKKQTKKSKVVDEMIGLGKGIFSENSLTLQKKIREDWKL